jgi:RNA ligase (TIGR02306 family)
MSSFSCPVVSVKFEKHPNADRLSVAHIVGTDWQCVVNTEGWEKQKPNEEGNILGVYIPIGSLASKDHPLLGFLEGKKVKTCRLRKVLSQGVLLPLDEVVFQYHLFYDEFPQLGDDLAEVLEVTKWQPPVNFQLGKVHVARVLTDGFNKYTDIEHIKKFSSVLAEGEEVCVTEKLHGTSARYGLIEGKTLVGTRNTELDTETEDENVWLKIYKKYDLYSKLRILASQFSASDAVIYGEIVGPKVQDLTYGLDEPDFYVYDISLDQKYVSPEKLKDIVVLLGLKRVPELYVGPFNDHARSLVDGKDFSGTHCREGVVVEPVVPRYDLELGRVKLKLISVDYELRSGATDFAG